MEAIAISLGYDEHYFDEFCTESMAFYKLLHYSPQASDADALQRGFGADRDFRVIPLLLQGDVPGLEVVRDEDTKSWYSAPPVKGAYVVNLGNPFEQRTNDRYVSNVHRAIDKSGVERFFILFKYNGNPDFITKCIETCREKPRDEKYASVSVEDSV